MVTSEREHKQTKQRDMSGGSLQYGGVGPMAGEQTGLLELDSSVNLFIFLLKPTI